MNLNLSDSDFYNAYGIYKEDALEVLMENLEKLVKEIKEAVQWKQSNN